MYKNNINISKYDLKIILGIVILDIILKSLTHILPDECKWGLLHFYKHIKHISIYTFLLYICFIFYMYLIIGVDVYFALFIYAFFSNVIESLVYGYISDMFPMPIYLGYYIIYNIPDMLILIAPFKILYVDVPKIK